MKVFRRRGWKFLDLSSDGVIQSAYDSSPWIIGEWRSLTGHISRCENGFHASPRINEAHPYVSGDVLALVEGSNWIPFGWWDQDKQAFRHMRIVRAWKMPPRWNGNRRNSALDLVWNHTLSPNAHEDKISDVLKGWEEIKPDEHAEVSSSTES